MCRIRGMPGVDRTALVHALVHAWWPVDYCLLAAEQGQREGEVLGTGVDHSRTGGGGHRDGGKGKRAAKGARGFALLRAS